MRAAGGLILSELSLGSPATQCRLLHGGATHWRRRLTPLGGVSLFECPQSPFQDAPMLGEGLRRASQSPSRLRLRCSKARCGLGHLPSQSHIMDTLISFSAAPALAAERNCPWKRLSGARDPGPPANAPGPI